MNLVSAGPLETLAAGGIPGFSELAGGVVGDRAAGLGPERRRAGGRRRVLSAVAARARGSPARSCTSTAAITRWAVPRRRAAVDAPASPLTRRMSGAILLTGATGFLGMDALARLIERGEEQIVVLIRARGRRRRARERLRRCSRASTTSAAGRRAGAGRARRPARGGARAVAAGPRAADRLGRANHPLRGIDLLRAAARGGARDQRRRASARVRRAGPRDRGGGSLRRLVHVSTAYVSGRHAGEFGERDLDVGQEFRNSYERSKNEAEQLLGEAADLPLVIARPSIVVGHIAAAAGRRRSTSSTGRCARSNADCSTEVPAREDSIVDFVPVDYVTDGILALLDGRERAGHLQPGRRSRRAERRRAGRAALLDQRRPPVRFAPQDSAGGLPAGAETFVPYFDVRCRFTDERAARALARAGM